MKKWVEIWAEYKDGIEATMERNLDSDAIAGYSMMALEGQVRELANYRKQYRAELKAVNEMSEDGANKWCHSRLIALGAI